MRGQHNDLPCLVILVICENCLTMLGHVWHCVDHAQLSSDANTGVCYDAFKVARNLEDLPLDDLRDGISTRIT